MFAVKISNIIGTPRVSRFKMKWRGGCSPEKGNTQGVDGIFCVYFWYYCPPACHARCCRGAPASPVCCWCPPPSLLLLQLPGSLLPRKGKKSPPRGSYRGQRRLERKDRGFHHRLWMLPNHGARPDPRRLLGGAQPRRQPCSPAPVSTARRSDICFIPLVVGFGQKLKPHPWGGGWEALQGHPLWVTCELISLLEKC